MSMVEVYELIRANPDYFAWAFGLVNIGWIGFVYFNSKRHDRELISLKHSLDLDLERRKHAFELRSVQYDRYAKLLDDFGRKYQTEMMQRMQPIFTSFLAGMTSASNEQEKRAAVTEFSAGVMSLMGEASTEYLQIKAESRSLRLTSSDELCKLLDEMEQLMKESMETGNQLIASIPVLVMAGESEKLMSEQKVIVAQGEAIQEKSKEIENQMRAELRAF